MIAIWTLLGASLGSLAGTLLGAALGAFSGTLLGHWINRRF